MLSHFSCFQTNAKKYAKRILKLALINCSQVLKITDISEQESKIIHCVHPLSVYFFQFLMLPSGLGV